ncbi:hypothetical protein V1507DRAFT_454255 [Lipomyces tetrasporus]
MEHSDLLEIVRRPLSPDARLEVPASREEYERVNIILERDETKYVFHRFVTKRCWQWCTGILNCGKGMVLHGSGGSAVLFLKRIVKTG